MRGHDQCPAIKLSRAALTSRAAHAAIAAEQLLSSFWCCRLTSRLRTSFLWTERLRGRLAAC